MQTCSSKPRVVIACGGTGGHLFPGMAVGEELVRRGCEVLLLISQKEVDQVAVKSALGMDFRALPAIGFARGRLVEFIQSFWKSYFEVKAIFRQRPPQAVLAMGGFTGVAPILAGQTFRRATVLHQVK